MASIKETYFCDKLFASLGHKALSKSVYLLHSEWLKLHRVVAILSAIGLKESTLFLEDQILSMKGWLGMKVEEK